MDFLDDPEEMAPEQRLAEVAAILAAGFLRLRAWGAELAGDDPALSPSPEKRLNVSGAPRPPLDEGLTGGDPAPVEASG